MNKVTGDFISNDKRTFKWKLGKVLASSLSGFIAGIIVSAVFFMTVFDLTLKGKNIGF